MKTEALEEYRSSRRTKENGRENEEKSSWRTRIGLHEYKGKSDEIRQKSENGSVDSDDFGHRPIRRRHAFTESSESEPSVETNYRSKYRNHKSVEDNAVGNSSGDLLQEKANSKDVGDRNNSADVTEVEAIKTRNIYVPYSERKKEYEARKNSSDNDDGYVPFSDRRKKSIQDTKIETEGPYIPFSERAARKKSTSNQTEEVSQTDSKVLLTVSDNSESNKEDDVPAAKESLDTTSTAKSVGNKTVENKSVENKSVENKTVENKMEASDGNGTDDSDAVRRADRIARYKEERRRQLATFSNLQMTDSPSGSEQPPVLKPSLFLGPTQTKEKNDVSKPGDVRQDDGARTDSGKTKAQTDAQTDRLRPHRRRLPDIPTQSLKEKEQRLQDFIHSQARSLRTDSSSSQSFEEKPTDLTHSPVTKPATNVRRSSSLKVDPSKQSEKATVRRQGSYRESPASTGSDSNSPRQPLHTSTSLSSSRESSPACSHDKRTHSNLHKELAVSDTHENRRRDVLQNDLLIAERNEKQIQDKLRKDLTVSNRCGERTTDDQTRKRFASGGVENGLTKVGSTHSESTGGSSARVKRSSSDATKSSKGQVVARTLSNVSDRPRKPVTEKQEGVVVVKSKTDLNQLKLQQPAGYKHAGEVNILKSSGDRNTADPRHKTSREEDYSNVSKSRSVRSNPADGLVKPTHTSSSNLDDLLKQNANYLSDLDLELSAPSPSVKKVGNEASVRRSLKKKKLVRSSSSKGKGEKLKAGSYRDLKRYGNFIVLSLLYLQFSDEAWLHVFTDENHPDLSRIPDFFISPIYFFWIWSPSH